MAIARTSVIPGSVLRRFSRGEMLQIESLLRLTGMGEVECITTEIPEFFHSGVYFQTVHCPSCFAPVSMDIWHEHMARAMNGDPRTVRIERRLDCGCDGCLFDELVSLSEQGFACDSVSIVDRTLLFPCALVRRIESIVNAPVRVVSMWMS